MGRVCPQFLILLACTLLPVLAIAEDSLLMPLASESLLLDVVSIDKRLLTVGERGHILFSDDGGESWDQAQVPTRQMLTAVTFPTATQGWAVGHDGLILASVDGGEHWVIQRDGLRDQRWLNEQQLKSLQMKRDRQQQDQLAAESRGQREQLQLSLQELELDLEDASLALQDSIFAPPLLDVYFPDQLNGVAVGAFNTLLITADGGASWQHISDRLENPEEFHLNGISGDSRGNYWIAGEAGMLFHSPDQGQTWKTLASPYAGSWFGIDAAPQSGRLLVFGLRGNVFTSDDAGESWIAAKSASERSLAGGGFLNDRYVMLVGAVGTLLISEDAGASFSSRVLGKQVNLSGVSAVGNKALIVGQGGVYKVAGVGGGW